MEKTAKKHGIGIRWKIQILVLLSMLPIAAIAVYAISLISQMEQQYERSVRNIAEVNEFNINFEKELDRSMYYIAVGSYDIDEMDEDLEVRNPCEMIDDFEVCLSQLRSRTTDAELLGDIDAIDKMLSSLTERINTIIENVRKGGHYDENMELLQNNVYVLTGLIQNDISDYIYLEALNMENTNDVIAKQISWYLRLLVIVAAALCAATVFISGRISRKMTEPIQEICAATDEFARGDFSVRFNTKTGDELETLGDSFNSMVSEISVLVEDIKREQKNSRDAELRLLQEQITPHFLYNTLDAIVWLIEAGENEQAVTMVSTLSNFFRTTLSKGHDWITVAEEESHIRSYLEIQQFRYRDILDYEISIPEEIRGFSVMKLMLQPIVENALYHGIKNKRGKGIIRVTGEADGKDLVFRVEDNGIGMTAAELDRMRKLISGELVDTSQHGFGIANVEQRIRLNYGPEYGITVESTYGSGSVVALRIAQVENRAEQ